MSYLTHPWLLVAGICAVSLPVLIHLLNRRRFRIVDWAAMDFLLQADKQCRRRIQLQHWILLLLRSAAVVIIGLLLARPFIPASFSGGLVATAPLERIIVLDDSLSMQARVANETVWDTAKRGTLDLIRNFAEQHRGNDSCTLLLTSQTSQPVIAAAALTSQRIDEWQSRLKDLKCGDGATNLAALFRSLAESTAIRDATANRAIYLFTDMREADWSTAAASENLSELSRQVQGCFVIDAGNQRDGNLTVVRVETDGPMVNGVPAALDVGVTNQGSAKAETITVKLFVEHGLPLAETIERLAPGESSIVHFHSTFSCNAQSGKDEKVVRRNEPRHVRVDLQTENAADDILSGDSSFYFPARVRCGIHALLVDGDSRPDFGKTESFYLQRALAPRGAATSGILTHVVTENELDSLSPSDYNLVFLLNCEQLGVKSNENMQRLTQWVAQGGSLVLMPGDQTDPTLFNNLLWHDGQGLSPLKLLAISGDPMQQNWLNLRLVEDATLLTRLASEQQTLLQNVKVFRHWRAAAADDSNGDKAQVVARFSDREGSPAIAEKAWGTGRVVTFAIPADADWHDWPSNPSYVLLVQELVHSLIGTGSNRGLVRVGESIRQPLDVAKYEPDAILEDPDHSRTRISAATSSGGVAADSPEWQLSCPAIKRLGFYELSLSRRDGGQESALFAANADIREGDLKRVDLAALQRQLSGTNARVVSVDDIAALGDAGLRVELWRYLAWLLVAFLATEQVLGWLFGRERT